MKEIHLGRILNENRRRRGITQDELAEFLGVSKAAVSKWETETAYPDILMLPRIASYFDISIDELIGYEPQMTKEELRRTYRMLSREFTEIPFEKVLEHCRKYARKYSSCYPLLFQIGTLLVNHCMLAGNEEKMGKVVEEAMGIFRRVKEGTDILSLGKEAVYMEAYCLIVLNRPDEALELVREEGSDIGPHEPLLASAWKLKGNKREAVKIYQKGIYKGMIFLLTLLGSYLEVCQEEPEKFEETCRRFQAVAAAFDVEALHPGILLPGYIMMAQGRMAMGEPEKALDALEKYTDIATGDIFPMRLRGDSYFDLLDEWIDAGLELGDYPPRDEKIIRRSMTESLTENPAFEKLAGNVRFQELEERLRRNEIKWEE